jgi:hypothetical protein
MFQRWYFGSCLPRNHFTPYVVWKRNAMIQLHITAKDIVFFDEYDDTDIP